MANETATDVHPDPPLAAQQVVITIQPLSTMNHRRLRIRLNERRNEGVDLKITIHTRRR